MEVTHEAVLAYWPRLAGWLADDERGRALRRHLAPAALEWENAEPTGRRALPRQHGSSPPWSGPTNTTRTSPRPSGRSSTRARTPPTATRNRNAAPSDASATEQLVSPRCWWQPRAPVSWPCNNATTLPGRRWQPTCARCRRRRWTRTDGTGRCSTPLRRSASTRRRTRARLCCRPSSAAQRQRRCIQPTTDCTRSSRARTAEDSSPAGRTEPCSSGTPRRDSFSRSRASPRSRPICLT